MPDIFSKTIKMRKVHAYLLGSSLILSSFFISQGCTKDTSDDPDLIGNWKKSDDFGGNARSEAASFIIGDFAYVTTGATATDRFKDLWEYNVARRYWTQKADLPGAARNSAVAFSIDNKGYVGTGYDGVTRLNDFWEYDPAANQWTQKANFTGGARYDAVGFATNGKGYIACGYDGNYLNTMWQYDPALDQWSQKASVGGSKRSAAMAFVFNNKAYVCSGNNNGEIQRDLWVYDPANNQWTEKTKIYNSSDDSFDDDYGSIPRQNGTVFIMGNYVYLTAGENGSITSATWEYNPATDIWTEKTGFEGTGRTGAVGFTLNNRGFVLTGRSGSTIMDNVYEFLPGNEQVDGD
jgi:N-acetylneuraminic acid mutarotase